MRVDTLSLLVERAPVHWCNQDRKTAALTRLGDKQFQTCFESCKGADPLALFFLVVMPILNEKISRRVSSG